MVLFAVVTVDWREGAAHDCNWALLSVFQELYVFTCLPSQHEDSLILIICGRAEQTNAIFLFC